MNFWKFTKSLRNSWPINSRCNIFKLMEVLHRITSIRLAVLMLTIWAKTRLSNSNFPDISKKQEIAWSRCINTALVSIRKMIKAHKTQEAARSSVNNLLKLGHSKSKKSFEKDFLRDSGVLSTLKSKTTRTSSNAKDKKVWQLEMHSRA